MTYVMITRGILWLLTSVSIFLRIVILGVSKSGKLKREGIWGGLLLSGLSGIFVVLAVGNAENSGVMYVIGRSISMMLIFMTIKIYIKDHVIKNFFIQQGLFVLMAPFFLIMTMMPISEMIVYQIQFTTLEVIGGVFIFSMLIKYRESIVTKVMQILLDNVTHLIGGVVVLLELGFMMMSILGLITEGNIRMVSIIVISVMSIVMFGFIYFALIREKKQSEAIRGQSELLMVYTDTIEDLYDDIRSYKHDINNILLSLKYHIDEENMAEIKNLFYEDIEGIKGFDIKVYKLLAQLQNLKIDVLKGVILSKYQKALNQGIDIEIGIQCQILQTEINEIDLCRVVGIYLDNSIEAALDAKEKQILVYMDQIEDQYMIKISNTYNGTISPIVMGEKNKTTKGEGRGMGLYSASRIIKRNKNMSNETVIKGGYYSQVLYLELV